MIQRTNETLIAPFNPRAMRVVVKFFLDNPFSSTNNLQDRNDKSKIRDAGYDNNHDKGVNNPVINTFKAVISHNKRISKGEL